MKERFNLNLDPKAKAKLEDLARKNNRSLSQMVEVLIFNENSNSKNILDHLQTEMSDIKKQISDLQSKNK